MSLTERLPLPRFSLLRRVLRTRTGTTYARRTRRGSPDYERTIARLDASGQKREADLWRAELAKLRSTLEAQMPPIGTKPRGPSTVIGITNEV